MKFMDKWTAVFVALGVSTMMGGCSDDGYKYRFRFKECKELVVKVGGINWHYIRNGDEAIIVMASGYSASTAHDEINLPAALDGVPVRMVCGSVFRSDSRVQSLIIPEGVSDIGTLSFAGTKIDRVYIPSSVTNIDMNAFSGSACKSFSVSDHNAYFSSVNGWLCTRDGKRLVRAAWGETEVPLGVEEIPNCAFSLNGIKSVALPDSVEHIGLNAFFGCENLVHVSIPRKVRNITAFMFEGCVNLESVDFSGAVTNIGPYAFEGCKSLTSLEIPEGVVRIDEYAFANCKSLRVVTIPSSVKYIGAYAFSGCGKEMRVNMAISDAVICPNAFSSRNHLMKARGMESEPDMIETEIPLDVLMK